MRINIPRSWDEVFTDQFITLSKLETTEMAFYEKNMEILSILTDTMPDDECWEDMDIDELTNHIKNIKWVMTEPPSTFNKNMLNFEIIDINRLTFGEFIDLDYFFAENYYDNLTKIAAILYKKTKRDEWDNLVYEPYGKYSIDERAILFEEVKITEIFGIIRYYLDFKKELAKIYEQLFEPNFEDIEEDPDLQYEDEEKDLIRQEEMAKKWSWESVLYKLSDGDVSKYDIITEMPVIFIFNQMSFIRDMKFDV